MQRIIIIEDDPDILAPMAIILENSGYTVIAYLDVDTIRNSDFLLPDIFLIDRQLNDVDGLDICRYLKSTENTKSIPVIMISASTDIRILAKEAGADDALEKPFTMKALRAIVAKHLPVC